MSIILNAAVDGLGDIPVHERDTDEAVLVEYGQSLALLTAVFNKDTQKDPPDTITPDDFDDIVEGVTRLTDLARDGLLVGGERFFITQNMAINLNALKRSFESSEFDFGATTDIAKIATVQRWRDLSDVGLRNVLQSAISALNAHRSLQSLIELDYVRTGNEQIFTALSELQEATEATKDALLLLERVQGLHNLIVPDETIISDPVKTAISKWEAGNISDTLTEPGEVTDLFRGDFDDAFTNPINVKFDSDPSTPTPDDFTPKNVADFNKLKGHPAQPGTPGPPPTLPIPEIPSDLQAIIDRLDRINGTGPGGVNEATREGTLADRIEQVLEDMDGAPGLITWVRDQYDTKDSTISGNIQRRITDAITTGESVNDQQRQELRRELFVFEEFYRSSSAILLSLNRIIEKMAASISGR